MRTLILEGTVKALSSVTHNGGQSFGISAKLRREKFVQLDGTVEEVPVISGNSLRGILRDRSMLQMCKLLGYGVDDENGQVRGLTLAAFHFLFSGGALTSDGGKTIDIERARHLRKLIPLVGVFGGALGNTILPGKLKVGKLIPVCQETTHLLPEKYQQSAPSIWEYLQEEMYTRKDDAKNEHYRPLIAQGDRKRISGEAEEDALIPDVGSDTPACEGHKQQMMYYVETFAAGTPFYWRITLDDVTDIEFEAFLTGLAQFSRMPYIGGKSAVGLGEIAVNFDKWVSIDSRVQAESQEINIPLGQAYHQHLQEQGEAIRAELMSL